MDKLIYELLQQMQKENSELKQVISTMQHTQEIMNQNLHKLLQSQDELKDDVKDIKQTFANLGEMLERKINMQEKEDNIMKTLRYLSHKVAEHDEEIFHLKKK